MSKSKEILCAFDKEDETYPCHAVFEKDLFPYFREKFSNTITLIVSEVQIKELQDCSYEKFCELIKLKIKIRNIYRSL